MTAAASGPTAADAGRPPQTAHEWMLDIIQAAEEEG